MLITTLLLAGVLLRSAELLIGDKNIGFGEISRGATARDPDGRNHEMPRDSLLITVSGWLDRPVVLAASQQSSRPLRFMKMTRRPL